MVNNPEYGVTLSPGAKRWLNRTNNTVKQRDTRVVSARLNDDVVERLKIYAKENNLTVNQLIAQVIEEKIGEAVDT